MGGGPLRPWLRAWNQWRYQLKGRGGEGVITISIVIRGKHAFRRCFTFRMKPLYRAQEAIENGIGVAQSSPFNPLNLSTSQSPPNNNNQQPTRNLPSLFDLMLVSGVIHRSVNNVVEGVKHILTSLNDPACVPTYTHVLNLSRQKEENLKLKWHSLLLHSLIY